MTSDFAQVQDCLMASLDTKTQFDVAKPSVVSKILCLTGVHGHVVAVWQKCWTCKAQHASRIARRSFGLRGASAKAEWMPQYCGVAWSTTCNVKLRNKGRLEEWGLPFGGKYDNEFMLRSMMWADTYWLFSDSKDKLVYMVNDIIGGLLGGFCSPSYLCLKSG